jgi:hypothetical protein
MGSKRSALLGLIVSCCFGFCSGLIDSAHLLDCLRLPQSQLRLTTYDDFLAGKPTRQVLLERSTLNQNWINNHHNLLTAAVQALIGICMVQ